MKFLLRFGVKGVLMPLGEEGELAQGTVLPEGTEGTASRTFQLKPAGTFRNKRKKSE
jgi:hypothetical protein